MVGKVILNLEIYKTVIASTVRYANARIPEDQWAEVYGLLFGYNKGEDVYITEAIPFTHTKKKGHILKVEFEEQDYALASDIELTFYDRTPPQFIVGWFHSHPGIKVMMSQDDVQTHLFWQSNNPLAIALVFNMVRLQKQFEMPSKKGDPVIPLKDDLGFEIFRLDDTTHGIAANYHKIAFEFSDMPINETLVKNAQDFITWVTKAFPRDDKVVEEYRKYVDSVIVKLNDLLAGTQSYLITLTRKNESHRIPEILAQQENEAKKILETGGTMISVFRMMIPYLEYKEREILVPKIENILKIWDERANSFIAELRTLPDKIKNQ